MTEKDKAKLVSTEKRKAAEETEDIKKDLKKVELFNLILSLSAVALRFFFLNFICRRNSKLKL